MSNRLSHSSLSRFQTCPTSFNYHYNKRLRSTVSSSALFFGTAVDVAITALLTNEDPQLAFDKAWEYQDVNGKREYLPTSTSIVYSNSDFDMDLLVEEDYQKIAEKSQLTSDIAYEITEVYKEKEYLGFDGLQHDRKVFLNLVNWHCLYRKGLIMIKSFKEQILPNIEEVLGSQVKVDLDNGEGDSVLGFADMVVRYKGFDKPIILDLKTSSRDYDKDIAVTTSPQLSLYLHALSAQYEDTRLAGYVVLNKQIRKNKTKACSKCGKNGTGQRHKTCDSEVNKERCNGEWIEKIDPEAKIQVLIEEIPEQTENIVLENVESINRAIDNGNFYRNLSSCQRPWGPCEFFRKCYHNTNEGLVQLNENNTNKKS